MAQLERWLKVINPADMFYELVVSGVCGGGIQDLGGDAEGWEQLEGALRRRERAWEPRGDRAGLWLLAPSPTPLRLHFLFHLTATASLRQRHGRAQESNEKPSAILSFVAP